MTQATFTSGTLSPLPPAQVLCTMHMAAEAGRKVMGPRTQGAPRFPKPARYTTQKATGRARQSVAANTLHAIPRVSAAPFFSVIVTCLNAADRLAATLDSLAAQGFANWEAIVVDTGSTDASLALLHDRAARDPRIAVVRAPRQNRSAARNLGALTHARGRILAFCDADGGASFDHLGQLHRFYLETRADGTCGPVAGFDEHPRDPRRVPTPRPFLKSSPASAMSHLSVRRDAFIDAGGFDEGMDQDAELDVVIRMIAAGASIRGLTALQVRVLRPKTARAAARPDPAHA
ncbi:MAG: hypothetical protein CML66_02905 [Rhodobacteraceae bacterium]|nr:hypothetical protein [Paracoccaceae bacterium]MAY47895.1 hypothetical protein [Paracoccaceae bacterium]